MHKCHNAKKRGELMTELDYDEILCKTIDKLEESIADGTFCE